jgi:hypothetical protein
MNQGYGCRNFLVGARTVSDLTEDLMRNLLTRRFPVNKAVETVVICAV